MSIICGSGSTAHLFCHQCCPTLLSCRYLPCPSSRVLPWFIRLQLSAAIVIALPVRIICSSSVPRSLFQPVLPAQRSVCLRSLPHVSCYCVKYCSRMSLFNFSTSGMPTPVYHITLMFVSHTSRLIQMSAIAAMTLTLMSNPQ